MEASGDDVVAEIAIRLRANGSMSIEGNIGDVRLAVRMVDHARDALAARMPRQDKLVIPAKDVVVVQDPRFPTVAKGDASR